MKRETRLIPGFDCGPNGINCEHHFKGDHGRHGPDWVYSVVEAERFALSLRVFTEPEVQGADLTFHISTRNPEASTCGLVESGHCREGGNWALRASKFFVEHGAPTLEQPESFWIAMETELLRLIGNGREVIDFNNDGWATIWKNEKGWQLRVNVARDRFEEDDLPTRGQAVQIAHDKLRVRAEQYNKLLLTIQERWL